MSELKELSMSEVELVSGGYWDWGDISGSIGYNIGAGAGYIYNNVIIGNGVIDDLASLV